MTEEQWQKLDGKIQQRLIGELRHVRYIYDHLLEEGYGKVVVYIEEETLTCYSWPQFMTDILACDECTVRFRVPDTHKVVVLNLVFGNAPEEVVNDYYFSGLTDAETDRAEEIIKHASCLEEYGQMYYPKITMEMLKQ